MAAKAGTGWGAGMAGCHAKLMTALKLTDSQTAELKRIRENFLAATKADREQMQAKMKQMRVLWAAKSPDAEAIKAVAGEIDTLHTGIRSAAIDSGVDGLKVLTDKQRQTVRDYAKKCIIPCGCGACVLGIGCPMGGPGMGMGMGMGAGMGGYGMGNATGPRARAGTCPKMSK